MAAYGVPSYITALGPDGWVRYLSRAGCTQGCGLGPLCFAAALHIVLERVVGSFPDCAVVALHDDVGIAGPPACVRRGSSGSNADTEKGSGACLVSRVW